MAIVPMFDTDFESLEAAVKHLREASNLIRSVTTCAAVVKQLPEIADRLVTLADELDVILNEDMHADLGAERLLLDLIGDIPQDETGDT